jgi:DNA end-binding protein Ku
LFPTPLDGKLFNVQTIWKGAISFGLVTIPVRLYAATEERDVAFHQVHVSDGSRIRYRRICEQEGKEIAFGEIAKGYELPDGGTIILTKEDFASLPLVTNKTIEVLKFVPVEQIDPIYFARSYYLRADAAGEKPYVLLRDALGRAGQVALVKVALRNREALATLRSRDDILVLQTMLWPDEIRDAKSVAPSDEVEVRSQEIEMAQSYIETLSGDFEPEEYADSYRAALEELIQAKIAGREVEPPREEAETGKVIDLMAALRASVEQARKGRAESAGGATTASGTAAKRTAAKKEPAKKAPAKKATAAKATAAKAPAEATAKRTSSRRAAGAPGEDGAAAKKATAKKAPAKKTAAKKGARKTA